jgi:multiple sugar transport system ATP-binding protein
VAAISLRGLTKVYATGVVALDGLDLDVDDGEFVVLVGPSGCGKTTALRMVAGLERITSGTVSFGDRVVNDTSPRHRDVAMVFQNYALYPHLSVYQNIGFALENKKIEKAERDRLIRSAAAILGLQDVLGRKPKQLSGGQRQRVAMGRAIVRSPAVFLMDEPLSNLDAKLRVQMRSEVLRVHRSIGAATLYVTHDQTEAMTMGDRVAVLHGGVLQQYGTPRSLYASPANVFVATFIGSPAMNLYEAGLEVSGSGPTVLLGAQQLALPAQVAARVAAYQGRKIIVGVRPEDLAVGRSGGALGALVADVRLVEVLGSEQHVYFWLDATPAGGAAALADESAHAGILAASAPNGVARVDPRSPVRAGGRVTFAVDPARLYFFDPDTGHAVTSLLGGVGRAPPICRSAASVRRPGLLRVRPALPGHCGCASSWAAPALTCAMASTSTGVPRGSAATPMAERACAPAAPRTSSSSCEAPSATCGCCTNSPVQAMYTVSLTSRVTASRLPAAACSCASTFTAHARAASCPAARSTSAPSRPVATRCPSRTAICPEM